MRWAPFGCLALLLAANGARGDERVGADDAKQRAIEVAPRSDGFLVGLSGRF